LKLAKPLIHGALLVALALATRLGAQDTSAMHVTIHVSDSAAQVVDRVTPDRARFAIVSENGDAALLLMDTTIVAQMTDRGLAHMKSQDANDTTKSAVSKMFARMTLAALGSLFDHGIAYHLRDLTDAKYADGRLQLKGANGEEIFGDVEINKAPLMESFRAEDAKAFAAKVRVAKARFGQ
jgi:hypothetical protein